jgi:hypothetical protein
MRNVVQRDCTRPHPSIDFVNRENYVGSFSNREFHTHVRINSKGLRDREYSYERIPSRPRCLVLGDSFVFGWGVEADESVSKLVEARLHGVEVINAGCSGWSTRQELLFFEEEGIRYRPDVVLLFFCENDPDENPVRYAFAGGRLTYAGIREDSSWGLRGWFVRHSALFNLFREASGASVDNLPQGAPGVSLWGLEEEYLRSFHTFCDSHAAAAALVYVPHKNRRGLPRHGSYFQELEAFCRRDALPFIDLVPAMAEERKPVFFRLDDHWNTHGHEVAARVVARFLRESGWIDPRPSSDPSP